ncbi:MAG: HlyC/CorC family transporter [Corynebacteriales bacterium]|nr:HlyC/CorC family transporter [Mycobacteriales bacterium]
MSNLWALLASIGLLAANGFFVAAEFALVAAKQHRLDMAAAEGGLFARTAKNAKMELPLMLAGAQLGITLCSLGLGALAEPAIEHLASPALEAAGLPLGASHVISFILALAIVVFLHMVVGEMAPKSWAITHPERSAIILAWPFVAFTKLVRPALVALNGMANLSLRAVRVEAQGNLPQVHGASELQILLRQSREHGLLEAGQHRMLAGALRIHGAPIGSVARPRAEIVSVPSGAGIAEMEELSNSSGRSRLIVTDSDGKFVGIVHIRDVLKASLGEANVDAAALMAAPLRLAADTEIADAITAMREKRAQIAVVVRDGADVGLVALEDLLEQVIGQFDDETDTYQ